MDSQVYELNARKVVTETVDGESIIISLETGDYYSLNPVASVIWGLAITQHSAGDIIAYCAERYELNNAESKKHAEFFLNRLLDEGLLVVSQMPGAPRASFVESKEKFVEPSLEVYDDMREMLLADPIHDVDESGWPVLKKE